MHRVGGLCAVVLFIAAGCGGEPNTGTVSGKITYKGAPVEKGNVELYPAGDGGRPTVGAITNGSYRIVGVKYGEYKVCVISKETLAEMPQVPSGGAIRMQDMNLAKKMKSTGELKEAKSFVPIKYSRTGTTELNLSVKSSSATGNFELVD